MTQPRTVGRGGFHKPIRIGHSVRQALSKGPANGFALYQFYKHESQELPLGEQAKKIRERERRRLKKERKPIDDLILDQAVKDWVSKHSANMKKRHVISYGGFRRYLYLFRQLNLIDYVMADPQTIQTKPATVKSNPQTPAPWLADARLLRLVPPNYYSSAWDDPQEAAYPGSHPKKGAGPIST